MGTSYRRVLSRATWSSREVARRLLLRLLDTSAPEDQPVILGIDETLERRRGAKIVAKRLYRDNARSSKTLHVKSQGLRWISLMPLCSVPWASRIWALPFFTALQACTAAGEQHRRPSVNFTHLILPTRRHGWYAEGVLFTWRRSCCCCI
jgi:hypothetical protein